MLALRMRKIERGFVVERMVAVSSVPAILSSYLASTD